MVNKKIVAAILLVSLLGGCAAPGQTGADSNASSVMAQTEPNGDTSQNVETKLGSGAASEEKASEMVIAPANLYSGERPFLINSLEQREELNEMQSVIPGVESYSVAADLSNIENLWQFSGIMEGEFTEKLAENGFIVAGDAGSEFFEIYETNRYALIPSFVTVDSLMHTYHLYFSYLLKNIERDYLSGSLEKLSGRMLDDSLEQYEQLKGSEWESAARRNVAFFTVGAKLLNEDTQVSKDVTEAVSVELDRISSADRIYISEITGDEEDYTQYIPRGYYEGDEKLEKYFKAMMWYGRIHFKQEEEDLDRSAFLITKALADDEEAAGLWEAIYTVTAFFAGASDDLGVYEYAPLIGEIYGEEVSTDKLIGTQDAFLSFHAETAKLSAPKINSIPIYEYEDNVILGFRFMGQRFTIDAEIMQDLIYGRVEENSTGDKRMLPDVLDVPAALGSDTALQILKDGGATDYAGYTENMNKLRANLSEENDAMWSASLYSSWLNTLRPLLTEKGEGYPVFMQNEEWVKKDLECFAGSFTELKHDTILYSKQVIAEMGGEYYEELDDRGYVEPEPLVYARFISLADMTAKGLKKYGMLSDTEEENLSRLSQIAEQLFTISNKELRDEVLTDEEYDFIRGYGGNLEHFWYEAARDEERQDYISTKELPAAIVTDIATDIDGGTVLETATGNPSKIWVVIKVDGKIKLAWGSVYSFYQFPWPMDDRLTDTKWRQMMGIQADEDGSYSNGRAMEKPEWTESYRYKYEWE